MPNAPFVKLNIQQNINSPPSFPKCLMKDKTEIAINKTLNINIKIFTGFELKNFEPFL